MKKLLYVPIVHNAADLGSMGSALSAEGEKKYGVTKWQEHLLRVDKSWNEIEMEIKTQLTATPGKIKIFQDGLPAIGEVGIKIIKDTASKGSKNYSIIDNLLTKGAELVLAENKELLFKEYYLLSDIGKAETPEKQLVAYIAYQEMADEILIERDKFIANQINDTLQDGDTGIAFFGASHSIIDKLNKDIDVTELQLFSDEISVNLRGK